MFPKINSITEINSIDLYRTEMHDILKLIRRNQLQSMVAVFRRIYPQYETVVTSI